MKSRATQGALALAAGLHLAHSALWGEVALEGQLEGSARPRLPVIIQMGPFDRVARLHVSRELK